MAHRTAVKLQEYLPDLLRALALTRQNAGTEQRLIAAQFLGWQGGLRAVVDGRQKGHQPRADNGKMTFRNYKSAVDLASRFRPNDRPAG